MSSSAWFDHISQKLARTLPVSCPADDRKPAAVALMLQYTGTGPQLFFIERAHHPADPWSGNIGFPGGRRDPVDTTLRHTAERETMEEVGVNLAPATYLGRLSDIVGANLPVRVSCFVYGLHEPIHPVLSDEVHDAFWYDLEQLAHPQRQMTAMVCFGGKRLEAPAIDLGLPGKAFLWGITYRLVCQFRELLESGNEAQLPYELPL
jgi:8-oxo-dGTP pyrophosphatase MutT (NUDIX family)